MEELAKVRVVTGKLGAPHETLLVVDATTGQNGLQQARLFGEAVGVSGVALTNADGSARAGSPLRSPTMACRSSSSAWARGWTTYARSTRTTSPTHWSAPERRARAARLAVSSTQAQRAGRRLTECGRFDPTARPGADDDDRGTVPRCAGEGELLSPVVRLYLLVGLAGLAAYCAIPHDTFFKDTIAYPALGLASVVAIVVGIVWHRPSDSLPWILFAAGQLLFVAGDVLFGVYEHVVGEPTFPSPADAVYLLGYPLLAAGLWLLVRQRASRPTGRA